MAEPVDGVAGAFGRAWLPQMRKFRKIDSHKSAPSNAGCDRAFSQNKTPRASARKLYFRMVGTVWSILVNDAARALPN